MQRLTLFLAFSTICFQSIAIHHWRLNENGRIIQQIDSPFYMRDPQNLMAFLNQISYNDFVESAIEQLSQQRQKTLQQLQIAFKLAEQADAEDCFGDFNFLYMFDLSSSYLARLQLPEKVKFKTKKEPNCLKMLTLPAGPCCFDHLSSFQTNILSSLHLKPEVFFKKLFNTEMPTIDFLRNVAVQGLEGKTDLWKYCTISSYYWRMCGKTEHAVACSRLAIVLAPREFRDIPLLSLGHILLNVHQLNDADVILNAAVEHEPQVAENHLYLALNLAIRNEYNISSQHFDEAARLDKQFIPAIQLARNSFKCFEHLKNQTDKIYSYFEYTGNELKDLANLRNQILSKHELLLQQQVPLGSRLYIDEQVHEQLVKRAQYCSKRVLSNSKEPVLFCDFYSELQLRLKSAEKNIAFLEHTFKITSELFKNQFFKELSFKNNFADFVEPNIPSLKQFEIIAGT